MKYPRALLATVLFISACLAAGASGAGEPVLREPSSWDGNPVVTTRFGAVRGYEDSSGTWVWKAIPYARPPVGELRWRAPRDPQPWSGVRGPRDFAGPSTQYFPALSWIVDGSEDCLYLNVWRPRTAETNLPVYVWIHGGGNSIGSANQVAEYQGHEVAGRTDMVYVSINYRLGPMGWFSTPALRDGASPEDASGNYGTLDIIQALRWVRDTIPAFGGDPRSVLVAGESAGGFNVLSLLISPQARGLFSRALVESGGPRTSSMRDADGSADRVLRLLLIRDGKAWTMEQAGKLAAGMSASAISTFLRSRTDREILRCFPPGGMGMIDNPSVLRDGAVIPAGGFDSVESGGGVNRVPVIMGTNAEELKLFLYFNPSLDWRSDTFAAIARYGSMRWKAEAVDGVARKLAALPGQPPVYAYLFSWGAPDPSGKSTMPGDWGRRLGAFHSLEIPFFHGIDTVFSGLLDGVLFSPESKPGRSALSAAMMDYVAAFVRTGDPNREGSGLPRWEAWSNEPGGPRTLLLGADNDEPRITMGTREVTLESIREEMKANLSGAVLDKTADYVNRWGVFSR